MTNKLSIISNPKYDNSWILERVIHENTLNEFRNVFLNNSEWIFNNFVIIDLINSLITYYEKSTEYEKCAELREYLNIYASALVNT